MTLEDVLSMKLVIKSWIRNVKPLKTTDLLTGLDYPRNLVFAVSRY